MRLVCFYSFQMRIGAFINFSVTSRCKLSPKAQYVRFLRKQRKYRTCGALTFSSRPFLSLTISSGGNLDEFGST